MNAPSGHHPPVFPLSSAGYLWLPKPKVAGSRPVVRFTGFPLCDWVSRVWERVSGPKVASGVSRLFTGVLNVPGRWRHHNRTPEVLA